MRVDRQRPWQSCSRNGAITPVERVTARRDIMMAGFVGVAGHVYFRLSSNPFTQGPQTTPARYDSFVPVMTRVALIPSS